MTMTNYWFKMSDYHESKIMKHLINNLYSKENTQKWGYGAIVWNVSLCNNYVRTNYV